MQLEYTGILGVGAIKTGPFAQKLHLNPVRSIGLLLYAYAISSLDLIVPAECGARSLSPEFNVLLSCSRPSMRSVFEDKQDAAQRASREDVCLPALPGPTVTQKWHESAVSISDPARFNLGDKQNDAAHQGDTHASRSSESFDLQTITRWLSMLSSLMNWCRPIFLIHCSRHAGSRWN